MTPEERENFNTRFNSIDERLNHVCSKIDGYQSKKQFQILGAVIGSPVLTVIVAYFLTL